MRKVMMAAVLVALSGCLGPGPKMSEAIPGGVEVTSAPFEFFLQGVRGSMSAKPAVMSGQFVMICDPQAGGSLQARANASAQYSRLVRDRVMTFLVNPRVRNELMREVQVQSVPNQRCAVKDIQMQKVTDDSVAVVRFLAENGLMAKAMALPR